MPILFVCENNGYAIHTSQERRQGRPDICARAQAYGIPAERIEHNDVLYLFERTRAAAARIRAGSGPYFLEVMTYRWREHVGPNQDFRLGYRTEDEATAWIEADQVTRLESMLAPERREADPRGSRGRGGGRVALRRGKPRAGAGGIVYRCLLREPSPCHSPFPLPSCNAA